MNMIDTKSFVRNVNLSNAYVAGGLLSKDEAEMLKKLYFLSAITTNFEGLIERYVLNALSSMVGKTNE